MGDDQSKNGVKALLQTLIGIVIGALASGLVQSCVERQKNHYERDRTRLEHAAEILTLTAQAPGQYMQIYSDMTKAPLESPRPLNESLRVLALVELDYPDLKKQAESFEVACLHLNAALQELVMVKRGIPVTNQTDEPTAFKEVYDTSKQLREATERELAKHAGR